VVPSATAPASLCHPPVRFWIKDVVARRAGVYTCRDRRVMEDCLALDFFGSVMANPALAGLTAKSFAVLEGRTRVTHGPIAVPA
jgi:hypothetical protein